MNTLLAFLITAFSAGFARANFSALPVAAVVKVKSFDSSRLAVREGSGMLFSYDSGIYVLSSDHVIFRDNDHEHRVSNAAWGELKATFLFADWGRGISLLKLDAPPAVLFAPQAVPAFSDLESPGDVDGAPTIAFGYPAQTDMLIQSTSGLAHMAYMFDLMASNRQMAFLENGYAEFGMSGGPVMMQDGHFLGLLSHLLFWTSQNKSGDWQGQPLTPSITVLIVPFGEIKDVLTDYLTKKSVEKVVFVESNSPVAAGETKVGCSRLEFDTHSDSQGFLIGIDVSLLPAPVSKLCPNADLHGSPYAPLEKILSTGSASPAPSATVTGVRMEHQFKYGSFLQVDIVNLPMFVVGLTSNIRGIFLFHTPDAGVLKTTLGGFNRDIDRLLGAKRVGAYWQDRLSELKNSFQASLTDPSNFSWTAAHPSGIDDVLGSDPGEPSAEVKGLLARVRAFTANYAL